MQRPILPLEVVKTHRFNRTAALASTRLRIFASVPSGESPAQISHELMELGLPAQYHPSVLHIQTQSQVTACPLCLIDKMALALNLSSRTSATCAAICDGGSFLVNAVREGSHL